MSTHTSTTHWLLLLTVLAGTLFLFAPSHPANAQSPTNVDAALGSTFNYQGRLNEGSNPATGSFDFQFILYDAASGGSQKGSTLKVDKVAVSNGLFNVPLDFGQAVIDGTALFLEVGVKPAGSASTYTVLSPRTGLNAVPYAQWSSQTTALSSPDGAPQNAAYADNDGVVHIRANGEGRLRFDNQPDKWGEINRWFNRFEVLSPDSISFAIGEISNEKVKIDNNGLTVNGSLRATSYAAPDGQPSNALYIDDDGITHIRAAGEGRLRFDNQPDKWGEINRWFNRFEVVAPDVISFAIGGVAANKMAIDNNGVTVEGDIRTNGGSFIDDGTTLNVPDYVFEKDYKLMSLDELAAFLAKEKHLPGVPSQDEIHKNGLNMSQFHMHLLEKVEELTLYTLAQQKQIDAQQQQINDLAARLAKFEQ